VPYCRKYTPTDCFFGNFAHSDVLPYRRRNNAQTNALYIGGYEFTYHLVGFGCLAEGSFLVHQPTSCIHEPWCGSECTSSSYSVAQTLSKVRPGWCTLQGKMCIPELTPYGCGAAHSARKWDSGCYLVDADDDVWLLWFSLQSVWPNNNNN